VWVLGLGEEGFLFFLLIEGLSDSKGEGMMGTTSLKDEEEGTSSTLFSTFAFDFSRAARMCFATRFLLFAGFFSCDLDMCRVV